MAPVTNKSTIPLFITITTLWVSIFTPFPRKNKTSEISHITKVGKYNFVTHFFELQGFLSLFISISSISLQKKEIVVK